MAFAEQVCGCGMQQRKAGEDGVERLLRHAIGKTDRGEDVLVLFGLQGAGGVKQTAARREACERSAEDRALASGLACEVGGLEPRLEFGIARQRSRAAAWDVAEDEVEEAFVGGQLCGVCVQGARVWCGGVESVAEVS